MRLSNTTKIALLSLVASVITTITAIIGVFFGLRTLNQAAQSLAETRNANVQSAQSLEESKRANQGAMILSLNRDFFFNERLYQVRKAIENESSILVENRGALTDQDLDDYLGMFEMMDGLRDRKILDDKLLDENFCTFISETYQNDEVKKHIAEVRNLSGDKSIYTGFENLATKFCK